MPLTSSPRCCNPGFILMLSLSAFYLLPVFLLLYLLLSIRGHSLAAEAASRGLTWAYLLPLLSRRHAKCCLYTHFLTTRSRGSVFCCSWTALSKSLHSVCLRRTSDENSNRFFPTRSASSGVVSGPLPPFFPFTDPQTLHCNTKYFIFTAVSGLRRWRRDRVKHNKLDI